MKKLIYVMLASFFVCLSFVSTANASPLVDTDIPEGVYPLPVDEPVNNSLIYDYGWVMFGHENDDKLYIYRLVSEYDDMEARFTVTEGVNSLNYVSGIHQAKLAKYTYQNGAWSQPEITSVPSSKYVAPYSYHNSVSSPIIKDSSVDIYYGFAEDAEVFFSPAPAALYQIIQGVTTEEMAKTQSNLVGTMKILALCGVGLIALLMVLPLFGKVFRIFRVK